MSRLQFSGEGAAEEPLGSIEKSNVTFFSGCESFPCRQ
jgi:hypothetical protein